MDGKPVSVQPATSPVVAAAPQPVPPPPPKRLPKIIVLLALLVIVLFAAGGYYAGSNNFLQPQPVASPVVYASPQPVASTDPTAGWRIVIRNYLTFKVPQNWFYTECSDDDIYVGPPNTEDRTVECNFEATGTIIVQKKDFDFPIRDAMTDPETNEPIIKLINRKQITMAYNTATWQQIEVSRAGEFFVPLIEVYYPTPDAVYVITFTELAQLELFDRAAAWLSATDREIQVTV